MKSIADTSANHFKQMKGKVDDVSNKNYLGL